MSASNCHPERSEGPMYCKINAWVLRFAQDDNLFYSSMATPLVNADQGLGGFGDISDVAGGDSRIIQG
jgi:hypothetical protein